MEIVQIVGCIAGVIAAVLGFVNLLLGRPSVSKLDIVKDWKTDAWAVRLEVQPGNRYFQTKAISIPGYKVAPIVAGSELQDAVQHGCLSDSVDCFLSLPPSEGGKTFCFCISPKPSRAFAIKISLARTYFPMVYRLKA